MAEFPPCRVRYHPDGDDFPFEIRLAHNTAVEPHRHGFLEFAMVTGGSGTETVDGAAHRMEPGTVTLLLPCQIHAVRCDGEAPLDILICNFDPELLLGAREEDGGLLSLLFEAREGVPSYLAPGPETGALRALFEGMLEEYAGAAPWRRAVLRARLTEALALFDRGRRAKGNEAAAPVPEAGVAWRIVRYTYDHCTADLSLGKLGRIFSFSPATISRLFTRCFGQKYVDFLHAARIGRACALLLSTELTVSEIALEAGFSSFQTFSRVFARHKRCTPSEYRRKFRAD